MTANKSEVNRCINLGEFIDEATDVSTPAATGVVQRPSASLTFVDHSSSALALHEFTVLLKEQRQVTIRGHRLRHITHPGAADGGRYGITTEGSTGEQLVALFPVGEVTGIFEGNLVATPSSP